MWTEGSQRVNENEKESAGKVKSSSRRDSDKRKNITIGGFYKERVTWCTHARQEERRVSNEAKISKLMEISPQDIIWIVSVVNIGRKGRRKTCKEWGNENGRRKEKRTRREGSLAPALPNKPQLRGSASHRKAWKWEPACRTLVKPHT